MNISIEIDVMVTDDEGNCIEHFTFERLGDAKEKIDSLKEMHTDEVLLKMDCARNNKRRTA